MRKNTLKELTFAAMLGGAYAALTMLLPIPQYAGVQFRLAEALTLLPFLIPAATPGLFVGCFIANLSCWVNSRFIKLDFLCVKVVTNNLNFLCKCNRNWHSYVAKTYK